MRIRDGHTFPILTVDFGFFIPYKIKIVPRNLKYFKLELEL